MIYKLNKGKQLQCDAQWYNLHYWIKDATVKLNDTNYIKGCNFIAYDTKYNIR